jgi:phosphate-selective porin OprO/OprP
VRPLLVGSPGPRVLGGDLEDAAAARLSRASGERHPPARSGRLAPGLVAFLSLALTAPGSAGAAAESEAAPTPGLSRRTFRVDAGWPEGITYEFAYRRSEHVDEDARFTLDEVHLEGRVGLRLDIDAAGFVGDSSLPPFDGGIEVRRARFYLLGDFRLGLPLAYKVEFSIEGSSVFLRDFYLRWKPRRFADRVDIGYMTPPMGLENLESSRSLTFMEVASPTQALVPGYRSGIAIGGHSLSWRTAWAGGLYSAGQEQISGDASETLLHVVGRVAGRPWLEPRPDADTFLHLGVSTSFVFSGRNRIRYRARPESFIAPFVVDTGEFAADRAFQFGLEGAWVDGPLSLQTEMLHSSVATSDWNVTKFVGAYGMVSWVLTGEQRPYAPETGLFERLRPRHDFALFGPGWGALELGQRISWLELSNGDVRGGDMLSLTSGLTWHLGAELKLALNYVFAQVTHNPEPGNAHIFQARIEVGI